MTVTGVSFLSPPGNQPVWRKLQCVSSHPMEPYSIRRGQLGITLFEMLIVMGIVGILMTIAIPSYRYVTNSNRIAAEINGLSGDLQFARAEAIKEGQTVTVCVSTDSATCAHGNTSWQNGWIVFSDVGNDQTVDAGDAVLHVQSIFTGADTLTSNNTISAITFNREGFASADGAGLAAGTALLTLHAAPATSSSTRCLSLGVVGLISVQPYGGACT